MLSTTIRRRCYPQIALALVVTILAGVIAPPGSVSAATLPSHQIVLPASAAPAVNPLSLPLDALKAESMGLPSEIAEALPAGMMPPLDANGEPVGFLMNVEAMQQQTDFEPQALAQPISLSRVQSTYVASGGVTGTVLITFTVTNNRSPVNLPDLPEDATITDTIDAVSAIDFDNDPNVVRNVVIADGLTANAAWLDAAPLPDRKDDQFIWNLGDVPPLGSITATLRLEVPGTVADFTDLDTGATAYGTLQGRAVYASTAPATLAPGGFAQWLIWTVDADYYDEYAVQKAAELGNDSQNIFEYVRSLGYESYKGSLRGARGTLWSEAGNSVDQASLLVAMLRGSGVPARYRHGTLSTTRAQELILSMFPEPQGVIGHIPEGAEVADPANAPQLLEETVDHWWVEAYLPGQGWTHLDPSFSHASLGQFFYDALVSDGTDGIAELPDDLRHKVTMTLKVEHAESITALIPDNLAVSYPLSHTFNTVELVGNPVTLGHIVNSDPTGGLIFGVVEHTYLPYFAVGDFETMIQGTPFQELLSNFPFGYRIVTGEWLIFDARDTEGNIERHEREIVDQIGFELRQQGGSVSLENERGDKPIVGPFDYYTSFVAPSKLGVGALARQYTELQALLPQALTAQGQLTSLGNLALPLQLTKQQDFNLLSRKATVANNHTIGYAFLALSDRSSEELAEAALVHAYTDAPRIIIASTTTAQAGDENETTQTIILDLLSDRVRALNAPAQSPAANYYFQMTRGIHETTLETMVLEQITHQQVQSTATVMKQAQAQGVPLILVDADRLDELAAADLSQQARSRITAAVMQGYIVLVPARMVNVAGQRTVAWWQFDPLTGEMAGVGENGTHQGLSSYSTLLKHILLIGFGVVLLVFFAGFIATVTTGLVFVINLIYYAATGADDPMQQAYSETKALMLSAADALDAFCLGCPNWYESE